jgi:hypothetical protein
MNPRMFMPSPLSLLSTCSLDDSLKKCFEVLSNTLAEQSSQWDGFRHYSQPFHTNDSSSSKDRIYYGGTTKTEIMDSANYRIGIQHWASEGIAGKYSNPFSLAGFNLSSETGESVR